MSKYRPVRQLPGSLGEWVKVPDPEWRVASDEEAATRPCRHNPGHRCPEPPVAGKLEGAGVPRLYCRLHAAGRGAMVSDGQVWRWHWSEVELRNTDWAGVAGRLFGV